MKSNIYNKYKFILLFAVGIILVVPSMVFGALPNGFEFQTIAGGFNLPTSIAFANDGRIFVAEKGGSVMVIKNGALLPTPLITLTDVNTYGDRGLLGIAIDPNFSTNGYLYLAYTYENTPGFDIAGIKTGRIVRITVTGDTADESTKLVILGTVGGNVNTPSCDNYAVTADCIPSDSLSHSVGGLRFGPDGKLYATLGDGASFDFADPKSFRAQNIDSLAGKLVRINTNGTAPTDNPFYNGSINANRSKVFAYGLRNAFRFNFNPITGAIIAGDVGWNNWEEINHLARGSNHGWPCREGNGITQNGLGCTPIGTTTDPVYTYAHDINGAGAVTGGSFGTGTAYPTSFANTLFFGDYAQNFIKTITFNGSNQFQGLQNFADGADGADGPVEFHTGLDGSVYYLAIYTGELRKINYTLGNRQPVAFISATPTSGLSPLVVNFSSAGSNDPDGNPITYLWNFGDNTTSNLANPTKTYNTNGTYNVSLRVSDNQGGLNIKSTTITVGNQAPVVTINNPASGALYTPNQVIQLNGSGLDPETGALSSASLNWTIILHHNTHTHTIQTATGANATFVAPDHVDPDVYVEVRLTGTDSAGLTDTSVVNMYLNNSSSGSNLVPNNSVEVAADGNPNQPGSWLTGYYGVMNPTFTYPAAGQEGARGVSLTVGGYVSGDAKWYFSPVYVNENTEYKFSDYYMSTIPTDVTAQIGYADGSYGYIYIGSVPASTSWTQYEEVFRTPLNARTMTIFHSIANNGTLSTDNFSLTINTPPAPDTVAPSVTITNPTSGQTTSGAITLTADSTDNVAVGGVTFIIDGTDTGGEDTTAPYTFSLDTTTLSNGSHTISARARDTSNNTTTSAQVSMTVSNSTSTPVNMVLNGSMTTTSTTTAGNPYGWARGGWGTNTATFTYPVTGYSGNGATVNMTAHTSGDAKWYFNDVTVVPGQIYDISWYYLSNSTTSSGLRYTSSSGTLTYPPLTVTIPPAASWTRATHRITIPAGVTKLTVFHVINRVGSLSTDEFTVTSPTNTADNTSPVVSVTSPTANQTVSGNFGFTVNATDNVGVASVSYLVNGNQVGVSNTSPFSLTFNSTSYANGPSSVIAVARDQAGNTATSTPISFTISNTTSTTSQNLISNGNMETANGIRPLGWDHGGWGNSTKVYSYPVAGQDGGSAVSLTVTNYVDGDVKWYFNPVDVTPGVVYRFSDYFRSNTISDIIGRYTLSDGSIAYFGLVKEISPQTNWTQVSATFTPPVGVTQVTFFHLISANGYLSTDNASLVSIGTTTPITDLTPPIVSITTPGAGATVSGLVNLTASSTDNVGVTYVVWALNGNIISPNLTVSPYSHMWDSTSVINGTHILKATTHDEAGNNTATERSITVNNTGTTTGNNLIENSSLEVIGANTDPVSWFRGGWGTNTATLTYPVAGRTTPRAARVSISSYTDGDAKWYFLPKPVTAGAQYDYSNYYISDVPTTVTVRYTLNTGAYVYIGVANLQATSTWAVFRTVLTPPANATALTVFHQLNRVGSLTVDDYSLSPVQ